MTARPFRSIASVLIQRTIVLAVLCMVVFFCVQSWLLRSEHQRQFEAVMSDVANTSVPLLAAALWDIETQAVQAQLQFIAKKPAIGFARLQAAGGQVFEAGNSELAQQEAVRSITIYAPHCTQALGVLHLSGNPQYLWQGLQAEALRILLGYSALTASICALIAFMLKQLLQKPLSTVAGFASELTPHQLTTPLRLNRAPPNPTAMRLTCWSKAWSSCRRHCTSTSTTLTTWWMNARPNSKSCWRRYGTCPSPTA